MKKEKSMLEEESRLKALPADIPVNPDLTSEMLIDVAVNKDARVWVLHDRPFPDVLEWIELDADENRLVFITKGGRLNDFGLTVTPLLKKYLSKADTVDAYLIHDRVIYDYANVPLIIRDSLN